VTFRPRLALGAAALAAMAGAVALVVTRRLPAPTAPKTASAAIRMPVWTAAEQRAIEEAARTAASGAAKVALRPAVDADATDSDDHLDLESVYGDYHPFFARGDLDGDGRLDFVQVFVETARSGAWFHVAAFFGRPDGTFAGPVWVERSISLADGDVSVERTLVIVTPDLAADSARRWRWEPADHAFVDADAAPRPAGTPDDDAPEETPEQKPRARI
jgi:hypothetical protein